MKYRICISALLLWAGMQLSASNNQEEVVIKIIETSDVHGNFFPYNFIERKEWSGSLARVHSFVKEQREKYGDNCLLMDNGDILQGQPTAYYYNFMDTVSTHVAADMMNYMGYVVGNMGNHDVETGHAVYDRWIRQCDFPVLGANIIDNATGKPYLKPYEVLERDGVRIAVLGMITPAIPSWLPEKLWSGLHFEEMEPCARKWVKIIKEKEAIALARNPSLLIADEPTTALDVTIQAQVLEMIERIIKELKTTLILITHDLGVVADICDKAAIMYAGEIVEYGTLDHIYNHTMHPYSIGLFGSIPNFNEDVRRLKPIKGLMPDPTNLPKGCSFCLRCPDCQDRCTKEKFSPVEVAPGHIVRCVKYIND